MTKTFDITDDLKLIEERARQLRTKQKNAIGDMVIATGAEKKLSANQLTGALLDVLDRAKADPSVKKKWEEIGEAFFRRKSAAGAAAVNGKSGGDGVSPGKPPEPPRAAHSPAGDALDLLSRAQTE